MTAELLETERHAEPDGPDAYETRIGDHEFAALRGLAECPAPRGRVRARLSRGLSEILTLCLTGLSTPQIAARRGRSRRTVENQLAALYRKVGVSCRSELFARFAGRGKPTERTWRAREMGVELEMQPRASPERVRCAWPDGTRRVVLQRAEPDGWRLVIVRPDKRGPASALTAREQQTALLAALGRSNKAIGHELGLAPSTSAGILQTAQRKLGVGSRRELIELFAAAALAAENGASSGARREARGCLGGISAR